MPRRRDHDEEDEYDDRPRRRPTPPEPESDNPLAFAEMEAERRSQEVARRRRNRPLPENGTANFSLVLGLLSFVGGLTAIPGIIVGLKGMKKARSLGGAGHGIALTGTLLSSFGVLALIATGAFAYWWFGPKETREVAENNIRSIGQAMWHHEAEYGYLPNAALKSDGKWTPVAPPHGELTKRLSWRVASLPYLEGHGDTYRRFKLTEPWDGPTNLPLAATVIPEYADRGAGDPNTRYRVFYGDGAAFDMRKAQGPRMVEFTDGTSNTILIVETPDKVTWSQFNELPFDLKNPPSPSSLGKADANTILVCMADGSMRRIRKTISSRSLSALITANGGEVTPFD